MSLEMQREASATAPVSGSGAAVRGAPADPRQLVPKGEQEAGALANGLGWFSIGLGVAEILAPGELSEAIGVTPSRRNRAVIQAMGVREIVKGVGILSRDRPTDWLWGRVAGDVLDVALLGRALAAHSERPGRTTAAIGAVLGVAALDLLAAQTLSSGVRMTRARTDEGEIRVRRTVTVMTSPEEAHRFWSDPENLPRFMRHVDSVRDLGGGRTLWTAGELAGRAVEWEVETLADRPGEMISWRSVEGMPISSSGTVHFSKAPGDRGTEVTLELTYDPPLGLLGATLARLFREEPGQLVRDDLRRFKQLMEVGEILASDGTLSRGPRPAQPPEKSPHGTATPAAAL
jgi:uncharacterized membrane protein